MSLKLIKFLFDVTQFAYNPEGAMQRYQKRLGDPFYFQMGPNQQAWVSGKKAGSQELFTANPDTFAPLAVEPIEALLGERSLLILIGDKHLCEKKSMSPAFHGEAMQAYGETMRSFTLQEFSTWQTGRPYDIHMSMKRITLNVILSAIFGIKNKTMLDTFRKTTLEFLNNYSPSLMLISGLRNKLWYPWRRYLNAKRKLSDLLLEEIEHCRQHPDEMRNDILAKFVALTFPDGTKFSNESLLDELKTLLVGGHETGSTALTWALYYTLTNDVIKNKLFFELHALPKDASIEQILRLPYLTAICKEALRIHPIVPVVLRTLKQPFEFRGKRLNAGDTVGLSITLLHSDRETWEQPEIYDPDRFINRQYTNYEFAPFGGGARKCLGSAFALYEMKIILATLLSNIKLKITPHRHNSPYLYGMIMKPRKNIYGQIM